MSKLSLAALTTIVMVAFATNSVLGRAALKSAEAELIDPATYTTVRIVFGALVLALVQYFRRAQSSDRIVVSRQVSWLAAAMLTVYAVGFSFAYVRLDAASGTLILFAFVQLTMVGIGVFRGERPSKMELTGLTLASVGLVYLLTPASQGFKPGQEMGLMAMAGIGWGAYSVLGKGSHDPIADTARNFCYSVPFVAFVSVAALSTAVVTPKGFWLAAASGGLTSGLGYVLWYAVLPKLRSSQAVAAQLSVPIIAAIGGVIFAADQVSARTIISGLLILGGIALTADWKNRR